MTRRTQSDSKVCKVKSGISHFSKSFSSRSAFAECVLLARGAGFVQGIARLNLICDGQNESVSTS
jgi:hypothetical protein